VETLAPPSVGSEIRVASAPPGSPVEARWNLAFVGILAYLIVEYTRLPAMFPVLQVLHLGKVVVLLSVFGLLLAPRTGTASTKETRRIYFALIVVLFAGLLSALFTRYEEKTWGGFRDAALYLTIAFLISRIVNTSWRMRVFFWLFLLLNLKLGQFVIRSYFFLRNLGETEVTLAKGVGAGSTGFFSNSADLGVAMCIAWGLTMPLLFANWKKFQRLVVMGCSLTFLVAILLCGSRGALVGAGAIVAVALFHAPRKSIPIVMATLFIAGVVFFLPKANWDRLQSAANWRNDGNARARIGFWMAGLQMLRDHPFLGVGIGNFSTAYARDYVNPEITTREMASHSLYIQALSELGMLGTLPILLSVLLFVRQNSRTRRRVLTTLPAGRRSFEYCLAVGLDLALVGYLVSGAFLSVLFYPFLWILLGVSIGLSSCCPPQPVEGGSLAEAPSAVAALGA